VVKQAGQRGNRAHLDSPDWAAKPCILPRFAGKRSRPVRATLSEANTGVSASAAHPCAGAALQTDLPSECVTAAAAPAALNSGKRGGNPRTLAEPLSPVTCRKTCRGHESGRFALSAGS